jgi:hypothetical protein
MRGDASDTFAFAEFFPGPVKPVVAAFSEQIFNVFVAMRLCTPFSQGDGFAAHGSSYQRGASGGSGGGVRAEAERRRALALKVLDQRLHTATANAAPRSHSQPPSHTSGPTVSTQPQTSTQTAMTSEPAAMLGETNYVPDQDRNEKEGE